MIFFLQLSNTTHFISLYPDCYFLPHTHVYLKIIHCILRLGNCGCRVNPGHDQKWVTCLPWPSTTYIFSLFLPVDAFYSWTLSTISLKFQLTLKCKWQTTASTTTQPRKIYILQVLSLLSKRETTYHGNYGSWRWQAYCHLPQGRLFPVSSRGHKNFIPTPNMSRKRKELIF